MSPVIRPAQPTDSGLIFSLVRELAEYEKLSDEVVATEASIAAALFAREPRVFCDVAEWNGEPAGFTTWFLNFSTFRGRHGIFLEDVFVRPKFRKQGIGRALLRRLAARCIDEGYALFEWAVLDWNEPALSFYRALGAEIMPEWKICRLSGQALRGFAGKKGDA